MELSECRTRPDPRGTDTSGLLNEAMIDPVAGEIIGQKDLAERLLAPVKTARPVLPSGVKGVSVSYEDFRMTMRVW